MDAPSDQATLAALQALHGSSTVIMVTRRPSYVAIADLQVTLNHGGATIHELQKVIFGSRLQQAPSSHLGQSNRGALA